MFLSRIINWMFPRWSSRKLERFGDYTTWFHSAKSEDYLQKYYDEQTEQNNDQ